MEHSEVKRGSAIFVRMAIVCFKYDVKMKICATY